MKRIIKLALDYLGYEIRNKGSDRFTISGISYEVDPCSVGRTPQGEQIAKGAVKLIQGRNLNDLRILDICCGVGIIGLTIFSELRGESRVTNLGFADINIFNLNSLERTLKINDLDWLMGNQIHYWLSNGLNGIPHGEKFDLIVSNPPHYFLEDFVSEKLLPQTLGTYDVHWKFHKEFYEVCHEYLTERGEVWFLENSKGASESDLLPFVKSNSNLQYWKQIPEPLLPGFFWMFSKRK